MKEKARQLFKDKLVLVMMVLGLLTIVAAAGTMTIHRGGQAEETPYLQMQQSSGFIAENQELPEETLEIPAEGTEQQENFYEDQQLAEASKADLELTQPNE